MTERFGDTPWVPQEMKGRAASGGVCLTTGSLGGYIRTNRDRLCTDWKVRYGPDQTQAADKKDEGILPLHQNTVTAAAD